jgi:hypothetical protein
MKAALLTLVEVTDLSMAVDTPTANRIPIYRWSGEYFGFICDNNLFDATSNYLGWVENDGSVWCSNGAFLGQLVDDNYILKHTDSIDPNPKVPQVPLTSPIPPFPMPNRLGRILPFGWQDAFEMF